MKTVFVITCNDSIEYVVNGTQAQAVAKMGELKETYFQHFQNSFDGLITGRREQYEKRCHWSARSTPLAEFK